VGQNDLSGQQGCGKASIFALLSANIQDNSPHINPSLIYLNDYIINQYNSLRNVQNYLGNIESIKFLSDFMDSSNKIELLKQIISQNPQLVYDSVFSNELEDIYNNDENAQEFYFSLLNELNSDEWSFDIRKSSDQQSESALDALINCKKPTIIRLHPGTPNNIGFDGGTENIVYNKVIYSTIQDSSGTYWSLIMDPDAQMLISNNNIIQGQFVWVKSNYLAQHLWVIF